MVAELALYAQSLPRQAAHVSLSAWRRYHVTGSHRLRYHRFQTLHTVSEHEVLVSVETSVRTAPGVETFSDTTALYTNRRSGSPDHNTTLHYTTQYKTRRDKEVTRRDETTRRTAVGRISPGRAGRSEGVLRYRSVVTRSRLPRYLR